MSRKWYTRARRFPELIGRTPDGSRLWGGPYTYFQLIVMSLAGLFMWGTAWIWARGSLLLNAAVFIGVVGGAAWLASRRPPGSRNPLVLLGGIKGIGGGWRSDGHRLHPPGHTTHTVDLALAPEYELAPATPPRVEAPEPAAPDPGRANTAPVPAPVPAAVPPLSQVQQLLLKGHTP